MSLGAGGPRGCPPYPELQSCSTDCAAPWRPLVSLGMCHKQRCPSPSSIPRSLTWFFRADSSHSLSGLNLTGTPVRQAGRASEAPSLDR